MRKVDFKLYLVASMGLVESVDCGFPKRSEKVVIFESPSTCYSLMGIIAYLDV